MPGARCTRSLVRANDKKHTSIVTTVTPESPGIPRTMVLTLLRALPGDQALLTPSPADIVRQLDADLEASEPHDFLVRFLPFVKGACVHRIPPRRP